MVCVDVRMQGLLGERGSMKKHYCQTLLGKHKGTTTVGDYILLTCTFDSLVLPSLPAVASFSTLGSGAKRPCLGAD